MNPVAPEDAPKVRTYVYPHPGYWDAVQMMSNRMCVSEQKYGSVDDNYPDKADALATLHQRLARYAETGNTEWLLDAANMAVIEHLRPSRDDAHFRPTDSDESPGLVETLEAGWTAELETINAERAARGQEPGGYIAGWYPDELAEFIEKNCNDPFVQGQFAACIDALHELDQLRASGGMS